MYRDMWDIPPTMAYQLEKNMESEMETVPIYRGWRRTVESWQSAFLAPNSTYQGHTQ